MFEPIILNHNIKETKTVFTANGKNTTTTQYPRNSLVFIAASRNCEIIFGDKQMKMQLVLVYPKFVNAPYWKGFFSLTGNPMGAKLEFQNATPATNHNREFSNLLIFSVIVSTKLRLGFWKF